MIMETVKLLLLLLVCSFVGGMDNDEDDEMNLNHLDELLSLSELPLQKLLHVKRSFEGSDEDDVMEDQNGINGISAKDVNPEALPLTASGGKSRRVNPLLHRPRFRTATRRGGKGGGGGGYGGGDAGGWMQAMEKTKKADPSSIFQTSITALSFLAFGGYLLCLIVQAIRAKEAAAAEGDLPEEPQRFVILMQRPNRVRHRRSANKRKYRRAPKRQLSQSQGRYTEEDNKANYNEVTSSEVNEKCEMSCNGESDSAAKQESRASNISTEEQQNDYKLRYWPKANVDQMYRALIMIAEGYSMYHEVLHS